MLLIDSMYINNSGGLVLLNYLVKQVNDAGIDFVLLLDQRNPEQYEYLSGVHVTRLSPSLSVRKAYYREHKNKFEKVLCFGNIPPPIRLKNCKVYTYLHQYFYLDTRYSQKSGINRVKFWLKQQYLTRNMANTNEVWVQSDHMKSEFKKKYKRTIVHCLPFFQLNVTDTKIERVKNRFSYVSNGNPHKNHLILLKAWKKAFRHGSGDELHVTVSKKQYPDLCAEIDQLADFGVYNHDLIPKSEVLNLLQSSTYMIYPSLAESFGLALLEACQCGCKILAADLPYVHSVVHVSATFDPMNVEHIAACIRSAHDTTLPESRAKSVNQIPEIIKRLKS